MSINIAIVTADPSENKRIQVGNEIQVPTLGTDEADAIAVRLDELVNSIKNTVGTTITTESDLTIEITGGITLSAQGGAKWLFFNIGGGAKTSDTLKVVLKTKLQPLG